MSSSRFNEPSSKKLSALIMGYFTTLYKKVSSQFGIRWIGRVLPRSMDGNNTVSNPFMTLRASGATLNRERRKKEKKPYIRLSVTLTRLDCRTINLLASWSFRALLICRTTRVSKVGTRSVSIKKARISSAVTRGGRSCKVSTGSRRELWRLIRSKAGVSRSDVVCAVGRRYIRKSVRKTPLVSVPGWYTRLQYLIWY